MALLAVPELALRSWESSLAEWEVPSVGTVHERALKAPGQNDIGNSTGEHVSRSRVLVRERADEAMVARAIENYRPQGATEDVWDQIAAVVRGAVLRARPATVGSAYSYMRATAQFVAWCLAQEVPLKPELLYSEANIERYMATGTTNLGEHSVASYRAGLRRVGRAATNRAPWTPEPPPLGKRRASRPYTTVQMESYIEIAAHQRTATRKRAAAGLIGLLYGAGVSTSEMVAITGSDLVHTSGSLMLNVPGPNPRMVPVLPAVRPMLRELATLHPKGPLVSDRDPHERSMVAALTKLVHVPDYAPRLDVRRLRSTWLVTMLTSGLRVSEVMALASIKSTARLNDILADIPVRDEKCVQQIVGEVGA